MPHAINQQNKRRSVGGIKGAARRCRSTVPLMRPQLIIRTKKRNANGLTNFDTECLKLLRLSGLQQSNFPSTNKALKALSLEISLASCDPARQSNNLSTSLATQNTWLTDFLLSHPETISRNDMSQSIKTVAANSHLFHLLPTFYTICINQYPQETWSTDPPLFLHKNIPLLAAKAGNLHALEFLHTLQNVPFSPSVMDTAASNGHYDIVRFLQSNRNREGCTTDAMDGASRIGDLRILRLLDEERSEGCTSYAMLWAIQSGRLDVVKFLVGTRNMSEELTGRPNREGVIANWCVGDAASRGHLNVVRYLCEKGLGSPGESGLQEAAQAGHVHVVEYLMETGFGGSIRDADLVALSGSYETFRFLHEEEKLSLTDTMLTSILQQSAICMKEVTDKSRELAGLIEILEYVMSQGALALESDKCNAQKLPNTSDKHRILSILNVQ